VLLNLDLRYRCRIAALRTHGATKVLRGLLLLLGHRKFVAEDALRVDHRAFVYCTLSFRRHTLTLPGGGG
jgi:hypothetical protein